MEKGHIRGQLTGYSCEIARDFSELQYLLDAIQHNLIESADMCCAVGTDGFDACGVHELLSDMKYIAFRMKEISSDIARYTEYLSHCGVPMSPVNSDFFRDLNV